MNADNSADSNEDTMNPSGKRSTAARATQRVIDAIVKTSARLSQAVARWFWREYDVWFGRDYFVAHRSVDGKEYAKKLHTLLEQRGRDCFVDVQHYAAGGNLTAMQEKELRGTLHLIVVVTPRSHDADAGYLLGEVEAFGRQHGRDSIISLGTMETLAEKNYLDSKLLPLLPHVPDHICLIESEEALLGGQPSQKIVDKLITDFAEKKRYNQRLWRLGYGLAALLGMIILTWTISNKRTRDRLTYEAQHNLSLGQAARGRPFVYEDVSPIKAVHGHFHAAEALSQLGETAASKNAVWAGSNAGSSIIATFPLSGPVKGVTVDPAEKHVLSWCEDGSASLWSLDDDVSKCQQLLKMDQGGVSGAVFCDDGEHILSWAGDGTVRFWKVADGKDVFPPIKHGADAVRGAAYSSASHRIASWDRDENSKSTVRLWDSRDGHGIGSPAKHEGPVRVAVFRPDGKRLLTSSSRGTPVRIWDALTGTEIKDEGLQPEEFGTGITTGAIFDPKGERILCWSTDGSVVVWSPESRAPLAKMMHGGMVIGAAFSKDGEHVLSWGVDRCVRLWNSRSGGSEGSPMVHAARVLGAVISGNNKRILSWSADKVAKIWDVDTSKEVYPPAHLEKNVRGAMFVQQDRHVIAWSRDHSLRLWTIGASQTHGRQLPTNQQVQQAVFDRNTPGSVLVRYFDKPGVKFPADRSGPVEMKFDSQTLAAVRAVLAGATYAEVLEANPDSTVLVWETHGSPSEGKAVPFPLGPQVKRTVVSADGSRILSWGVDGMVHLWNASKATAVSASLVKVASQVQEPFFSPDSRQIMSRGEDGMLRRWNAVDGAEVGSIPVQLGNKVKHLIPSDDGNSILVIHEDKSAKWWDLSSGSPIGSPIELAGAVQQPVISPDGRRVVSWSTTSGKAFVSEVGRRTEIHDPESCWREISGVQFLPDCRHFLTRSEDFTVRIWDAVTGRQDGLPWQHDDNVLGASASQDGERLLTWSADGTARLWSIYNHGLLAVFSCGGIVSSATFDATGQQLLITSEDGTVSLWDVSFNFETSLEERILEFEVRSATQRQGDSTIRVLSASEWEKKRVQLARLRSRR